MYSNIESMFTVIGVDESKRIGLGAVALPMSKFWISIVLYVTVTRLERLESVQMSLYCEHIVCLNIASARLFSAEKASQFSVSLLVIFTFKYSLAICNSPNYKLNERDNIVTNAKNILNSTINRVTFIVRPHLQKPTDVN